MNNLNKVPPFKGWVIQNFPFIEADFDAITNYELYCKIVEYLNKVIANENQLSEAMNYVLNYFNNLDVQDEINNKLDEMAESGQLTEIIAQYLQLAGVLAYNTISDMQSATNLANGSIAKTLGKNNYLDGYGAFYKIRTILNTDVIDGVNKISITSSDNLIAELIPYTQIKDTLDGLQTQIDNIERNAIYLGNSYTTGVGSTGNNQGIFALTKDLFKNAYRFTGSGTGFLAHTGHTGDTFPIQLQRAINDTSIDKNSITDIIVVGAWGDTAAYHEFGKDSFSAQIENTIQTFVSDVKNNYPNIKRIAYVFAEGRKIQVPPISIVSTLSDEFNVHNSFKLLLPRNGMEYLGWIGFNITLRSGYFTSDYIHPNDEGYRILASGFKSCYQGNLVYRNLNKTITKTNEITTDSNITARVVLEPDKWFLTFVTGTLKTGNTSPFNTINTIMDFSDEDWCLPIPFDSGVDFTNGFTVQTMRPNDTNFDVNTQYIGRLALRKTTDGLSTRLICTTLGGSKTVSNQTSNAIINPNLIYCDLEYK